MKSKSICLQCSQPLMRYDQRKFCSSSCSACYNNKWRAARTEESRLRTSAAVRKSLGISAGLYTRIYSLKCQVCERVYYHPSRNSSVCSKTCQNQLESHRRLGRPNPKSKYSGKVISRQEYHYYCTLAEFNLRAEDIPKIRNYDLLLHCGMWSLEKKAGAVRDHIFSRKDGWINGINPQIISHPANCQFLTLGDNSRKADKSWITYEQLLERIERW